MAKYLKSLAKERAVYDTPLRARYDEHGHRVVNAAMRLSCASRQAWMETGLTQHWLTWLSIDEAIVYVRRGVTEDDLVTVRALHALK